MNWLQAVLAFSLVMLVLATIVTIILETGYRFLLTREKGFRLMMERLFDEVLKPRVAPLLQGVTVEEARQRFLDGVTRNQGYEEKPNRLRAFAQSGELSSMTMMQFADRLADTDVGKAIARGGSTYVESAINDLAQKFDRFGQASSQRFEDHARFWCVLASILVAFAVNVDALRVFQSFLHNDALTSSVITRYGALVQEGAARPPSPEDSIRTLDQLQQQNLVDPDAVSAFKRSIAQAELKLADVQDTGLPVTAEYWPFCLGTVKQPDQTAVPVDRKCAVVNAGLRTWKGTQQVLGRVASLAGAAWFLSVLLAGLLVGLGAPFWFDLARGLTRSAQLLKTVGKNDRQDPPPAVVADSSAFPPPRTPVEAFTVAIEAARPARTPALPAASDKPIQGS